MIPDCLAPKIKHGGGSVTVWGCFSSAGVGDLVKIEGIMKKEQYKTIPENNAIPSGLELLVVVLFLCRTMTLNTPQNYVRTIQRNKRIMVSSKT